MKSDARVEINSYLLRPGVKITNISDVMASPSNYFVHIHKSEEIEMMAHKIDFLISQ